MIVDFEVIDLVDRITAYPALVGWPWGRKMKWTISLEKDRIKSKGNNKKIIIRLDPREGNPLVEASDQEVEMRQIYHVLHEDHDNIEPDNMVKFW